MVHTILIILHFDYVNYTISRLMRLLHCTTSCSQLTRSELDPMLDEVRRSRGVGRRDLATRHLW